LRDKHIRIRRKRQKLSNLQCQN